MGGDKKKSKNTAAKIQGGGGKENPSFVVYEHCDASKLLID